MIKKFISWLKGQTLAGILCLFSGVSFIVAPGAFLHAAVRIAGAIIVLVSAVRFAYTIKNHSVPIMTVAVINSILLFFVGLVMLTKPGGTLGVIYLAIGVYLVITAFTHIYQFVLTSKRIHGPSRWIELLTYALLLILGLWLALVPDSAQRITEIIAGIALIIKSLELFARDFKEGKDHKNKKCNDIEAEFVDKSHEL